MSDGSYIHGDLGPHDSDAVLAAELSLGLLVGDELASTQRRARIDRTFGALVEDWDIRFAAMTDDTAPVTPPKGIFRKITNEAYPDSPKRIWQQIGIIPALFGAGAAALVLVLALQFGGLMQPGTPIASLQAQIVAEDQTLVVAAAYVDEGGRLFVERQIGASAQGRALELWLIAGENAPVSLGVLARDETISEIIVPAGLRDQLIGGVLAISDEPIGGSPTGAPTGAVLAVGGISEV